MHWAASPSQFRTWTSGAEDAFAPGGPAVSLKVCLPPGGEVSLELLRESWSPVASVPGDLESHPSATLGVRSCWRGVPYQEVLVHPLRPATGTRAAEVLESALWKVTVRGAPRSADVPRIRPDPGLPGLFVNPEAVAALFLTPSTPSPREFRRYAAQGEEGAPNPRYRISVSKTGIYRMDKAYLQSQGCDLVGNPQAFHMTCQGVDVPIVVEGEGDGSFDPGDAIVFYGQRREVKDREAWNGGDWTDTTIYWLQVGTTPGARMGSVSAAPVSTTEIAHLPRTVRFEENAYMDSTTHFRPNRDLWFWSPWYGGGSGLSAEHIVEVPNAVSGACEVTAEVAAWAPVGHGVSLRLNGVAPTSGSDPSTWSGTALHSASWGFGTGLLSGQNSFVFSSAGTDYQIADYLDVRYDCYLAAAAGALEFATGGEAGVLVATGFPQVPYAFDTTSKDPSTGSALPVCLTGVEYDGTLHRVRFERDAGTPRNFALSATPLLPDSVQHSTSRDLASPTLGADLLVITHPDFHPSGMDSEWQAYLTRRRATMDVEVVDIQEVYDNFSDGIFDPTAIRTFLQVALGAWAKAPAYVLLVGDGTCDYKDYGYRRGTEPNYKNWVPTMMFEDLSDAIWLGRYPSDAWFGDVDGDGYPEVPVGRLPARTYRGFADLLAKVAAYEDQTLAGSWFKTHLYVGDKWDTPWEQDAFETYNETLRTAFSAPPWSWLRIFYHDPPFGGTDATACAAAIRSDFPASALVHYSGHSGLTFWSDDSIFTSSKVRNGGASSDVDLLAETAHLPFLVNSTCYTSAFSEPITVPLNEELVTRAGKGAIGTAGPSTIAYIDEEEAFASALFRQAFGRAKVRTVGDLMEAGRFAIPSANPRAVSNYVLLGDPTLNLRLPAPTPPPALSAVGGDACADLSWGTASEASGYLVERSEDGGATWNRLTGSPLPGSQVTFHDPALVNAHTYQYVVLAVDSLGFEGPPSQPVAATPSNPYPPQVPGGMRVVDPGLETVLDITWQANAEGDLESYTLARGTAPGIYDTFAVMAAGATSLRVSNLDMGRTYYFALKARNTSGRESAYCAEVSGVPSGLKLAVRPPAPITDLKVSREGKDLRLTWSRPLTDIGGGPADVTGYSVYRVRGTYDWNLDKVGTYSPEDKVAKISDPEETTFLDAGAETLPSPLTYIVVALSAEGRSSASNPPPAPVLDLRLRRSASSGKTLLSFSPVTSTIGGSPCLIDHYEVYGFFPVVASADHVAPAPSRTVLFVELPASLPACEPGAELCENPALPPPVFYTVVAVDRRGNRSLY